jgi:Tfp pilus assembly protein PilF
MDSREVAAQARDALRHHKGGKLAQARALYEAVLKKAPRHGPALHGLGMIFHGEGEHARAIESSI